MKPDLYNSSHCVVLYVFHILVIKEECKQIFGETLLLVEMLRESFIEEVKFKLCLEEQVGLKLEEFSFREF